jgi:hypothetical protein
MMGLLVILAGVVYLLISLSLIKLAAGKARQRGIAGWKWGVPAALGMYLLVFWDHLPTLIARQYYCQKEAGFTVYKTLDQWKQANPGVAGTLTYKQISDSETHDDDYIYHLNQRFDWRIDNERVFLSLRRADNKIIDVSNGEVLARYVDFRSGWGNLAIGANTPREYKFWLLNNSCEVDGHKKTRKSFYDFERSTAYIGRD